MVTIRELLRVFGRIGVQSFGGPAAQIALMHRVLVEERRWLTEEQYLAALSFCMLLPGPEAMQLATYAGWRMKGWTGGLIGGLLFVAPGAAVMTVLALLYLALGQLPLVSAMFLGIQAAVLVIVIHALIRVGRKALVTPARWIVAGLSFVGIFFLALPFPAIILAAGLWGAWSSPGVVRPMPPVRGAQTLKTLAIWGGLWILPVAVLWASGATLLTQIALFFSRLAVVTFGGAYAVLAYMTQEVVQDHGWLTTAQMMDGLGLAETTPGPLILVTQFVAMVTGGQAGGTALALAAGAGTLWGTFIPCFLWIFLGAPYIEWIAGRPRLSGALRAITAAVVGVILNLSVWFALHVVFSEVTSTTWGPLHVILPDLSSLRPLTVGLAILAAVLMVRGKQAIGPVLVICATIAAVASLLT